MSSARRVVPWRAARTAGAAMSSTIVALATHEFAGGSVTPAAAAAVAALTLLVSWPLTTQRVSASQVTGLLILAQAIVHLICAGDDMLVGGTTMLIAHAVATASSAIVLLRGEAWAWKVAEVLAIRPARRVRATPIAAPVRSAVPAEVPALRSAERGRLRPVRGPPVVA